MRRKRILAVVWVALVLGCAGLGFPIVQRVRDAAALSKCTCVKQLAYAVQCYSDVHDGRLPCGPPPPPGIPPDRRLSWVVETLPFVEASDVYTRFDLMAPADSERNRAAAATYRYYCHLVCPMSPAFADRDGPNAPELPPVPITNRVGCAGVGTDAAELPEKHSRAGVFGHDRRTRLSDGVPDGLSNTFLILETGHDPGHWAFGGIATVRPLVSGTEPYIGPGRPFGGFHPRRDFMSGSRGGIMVVAMADTTIRYIRGDIDPAVLEALATVAGKEPLPGEW